MNRDYFLKQHFGCSILRLTAGLTFLVVWVCVMPGRLAADELEKVDKLTIQCRSGKQKACSELAKIALEDKNPMTRVKAAENVTDQAVLEKIVERDPEFMVRAAALVNLMDQPFLEKIAKEDKDPLARMGATSKLTNQAVLAQIAKEDADPNVRKIAAKRVTDPSLAADVAAADKERLAAEDRKRALVPGAVWDCLASLKMPGWSFSKEETKVITLTNDTAQGKATAVLEVVFKGGSGKGVRFNTGSQAYFGPTISPRSGLPIMLGVLVYPNNGSTYMVEEATFFLVQDGGTWRISRTEPASLPVPPFSPM